MLRILTFFVLCVVSSYAAPQYYQSYSPSSQPCACANPNLAAHEPANPTLSAQAQPRFDLDDLFDVSIEHHHHHHRPHYHHRPYGGYSGEYFDDYYPYRGGYGGYRGGYRGGYLGGYRRDGGNAKEAQQTGYNQQASGQYNYQSAYQQGYQVTDPTIYSAPYKK